MWVWGGRVHVGGNLSKEIGTTALSGSNFSNKMTSYMHLGAFAQILLTILQKYCYRQCKSRIADAGEKIQEICGSRFAFKHILPHKIPKNILPKCLNI